MPREIIQYLIDIYNRIIQEFPINEAFKSLCRSNFEQHIKQFEPQNLLEEIGGFNLIKLMLRKIIENGKSSYFSLGVNFQFIESQFDSVAQIISSYIKNQSEISFQELDLNITQIRTNNLDFFILKQLIWKTFQEFAVPYQVQMICFEKFQRLRYKLTDEGITLNLVDNSDVENHLLMNLKSSNIINYYKCCRNSSMLKLSKITIQFMLGFINEIEFLFNFTKNMKKQINEEFLYHFLQLGTSFLEIQCKNSQFLINDFFIKIQKLRERFKIKNSLKTFLPNFTQILDKLRKWVVAEQYLNSIETQLLQLDVEKLDILEYYFSFFYSDYYCFSLQDFEIAKQYFTVTTDLLLFWLKGFKSALKKSYSHLQVSEQNCILQDLAFIMISYNKKNLNKQQLYQLNQILENQ